MSGPLPISFTEIAAWASLMKTEPWDWEIATICRMDAAFLAVLAGKAPISADAPVSSVDATDGREVIGFMRAMAARKKS